LCFVCNNFDFCSLFVTQRQLAARIRAPYRVTKLVAARYKKTLQVKPKEVIVLTMVSLRIVFTLSCMLPLIEQSRAGKDRAKASTLLHTTVTPSFFPTSVPSSLKLKKTKPTYVPSSAPLTRPPTFAPSNKPSAVPTRKPIAAPSAVPLNQPPATLSSATPAPSPVRTSQKLPIMVFTMQFLPNSSFDNVKMERLLHDFTQAFLTKNSDYSQAFVSLNMNSTMSYNAATGEAVTTSAASALWKGIKQPTQTDLHQLLTTYFSLWGAKDLQSEIAAAGFAIVTFTVELDGQYVNSLTAYETQAPQGVNTSLETSPVLIGGVVLAGFCCIGAGIFVYWKSHRGNSTISAAAKRKVVLDSTETFHASTQNGNDVDRDSTPPRERMQSDLQSLSEVMSLEDTVLTADYDHTLVAALSPPQNRYTYDTRRLDQVISDAKGFAAEDHRSVQKSGRLR
jgi:hypothetical protein